MYTARNGYEDVQKCIIACPRIKHRGNNRKKAPLNLVSLQKKKKEQDSMSEMLSGRRRRSAMQQIFFRGSQS